MLIIKEDFTLKNAYPIILSPDEYGFLVFVPDFNINTQGKDMTEAIEMARDAIGLMGIDFEDDGKELPVPSNPHEIQITAEDILSLVDVDFTEYRRKNELRTVKKNCTLPSWLCYEAEKANINFSQILQNALKQELRIAE